MEAKSEGGEFIRNGGGWPLRLSLDNAVGSTGHSGVCGHSKRIASAFVDKGP